MADAAVSMLMEPLISSIEEWLKEEISLIKNVKSKLKHVSSKLKTIQKVLDDAEQRSLKDDHAVQGWLDDLKDVSYEMDDVLDEWNTFISRRKLEEADQNSSHFPEKKIRCSSLFTSCISPFKKFDLRREIAWKIKDIDAKLDSIVKEMDDFKFLMNNHPPPRTNLDSLKAKRLTTSVIEKSKIHGRDDDEKIILSKLLSEGSREQNQNIPIISIVGLGGLGKTTLAKLVYNNDNVAKSFSKRIWVCVSDPFDMSKVVREIIESIDGTAPSVSSLDLLLTHLKRSISNVKFLLVLDDVWDKEGKYWEDIRNCLTISGAIGSRVLVTTRKEEVARVMGTSTTNLHRLGRLSDSACWSLFSQIAFADKDEEDCDKLREIGEKIVVKCKGLPLGVMTLGSLLRFKDNIEDWEHVLNSRIWELEKAEVDLFPHLYLSYNELSPPVKRCFSYCSIFLKDTIIYVDELIRIWIAQGYVRVEIDAERDIVLKGQDYFDKLTMCCFFQDFEFDRRGKIVRCKMHDIVHDFAQYLSRNECATIANAIPYNTKFEKVRHLNSEIESVPLTICDLGKLRSFSSRYNKLLEQEAVVLFNNLKCVRVLVLESIGLKKLPNEIGNLVHLRYLDLSSNPELDTLPEFVCELYNLQTLNIAFCRCLRRLPQSIGKLTNLRHLLNDSIDLEEYPKSFERLTYLKTLSTFVVGKKYGKLEHLQQLLQHLRGSIKIQFRDTSDCDVEKLVIDAKKIQLKNKKYLHDLSLTFKNEELGREEMWEALQPPPNTYSLYIGGIYGTQYPSWLTNSLLLCNLRELCINGTTPNCWNLPPLGKLSHLETLWIVGNHNVKRIGSEFLGIEEEDANEDFMGDVRRATTWSSSSSPMVCAFPKLVRLNIFGLYEWEEWEDINHNSSRSIQIMPQLRELKISYCQKLQQLPNWLLSKPVFPVLEIYKCDNLEDNEVIKTHQRQFEQQFGDTNS